MKHVFVLIGFLLYAPVLPAQILKGLGEKVVERTARQRKDPHRTQRMLAPANNDQSPLTPAELLTSGQGT